MGRGFSEILTGRLQGSPLCYVIGWRSLHAFDASLGGRRFSPGISAESAAARVAGANRIVYGYFSVVNEALRATAVQEDLATRKVTRVVSAGGLLRDGVFPVANALASQLGGAHPFGTGNAQALQGYVSALEAPNPSAASRDLAAAAAADPDFGRVYLLWLDAALAERNRAAAELILQQARSRQARFAALDRAALDLTAAALGGDFRGRLEALRALAQLDPANPNHHRALAEALMSTRDYPAAIVEFRRALSLRPDNVAALNSMGYAAAYSGDLPTAIRVLRAYEQLRPNEPNPLDSLGDAHFALGHFPEAERFYLAAHGKAPAFLNGGELLKAARARLMTGDVPGATELFQRYLADRQAAHDPHTPVHAAAWEWETGQRRAAIASLARLAHGDGDAGREIASLANTQAALWLLALGDRVPAAEHARQALAGAGPATQSATALVAYLAQPETYAAPVQSPLKDFAHAYALLLAGQFQPAVPVLRDLYQRPTNELNDGLAVLLAWAYEETGDFEHAEPLLRLTPLPQASGLPLLSALYFPRLFYLRGAALAHEGRRTQAARYYQLFTALSGPDSLIWGEEQRARSR